MNGKPMNDKHSKDGLLIAQLSIIAGVMFSLLGIIIFCVAYNMLKLDNSIGFVSVLSFTLPTLIGGLLLMRCPEEVKEDRDIYFRNLTNEKTDAIENDLHKEEHPAMPIHQERQSRVTFGGKKS